VTVRLYRLHSYSHAKIVCFTCTVVRSYPSYPSGTRKPSVPKREIPLFSASDRAVKGEFARLPFLLYLSYCTYLTVLIVPYCSRVSQPLRVLARLPFVYLYCSLYCSRVSQSLRVLARLPFVYHFKGCGSPCLFGWWPYDTMTRFPHSESSLLPYKAPQAYTLTIWGVMLQPDYQDALVPR
jgi:hypothetical protein